jgi:hypothetical protein
MALAQPVVDRRGLEAPLKELLDDRLVGQHRRDGRAGRVAALLRLRVVHAHLTCLGQLAVLAHCDT